MTLNFYVSYLVPVNPEKMQELEREISRVELTLANDLALNPSFDRSGIDVQLTRLRAQMEPERRREPARQVSHSGRIEWFCPRPECKSWIAMVKDVNIAWDAACGSCGAEVHKEELPMSLDLYRMRTRRTDGVEIQTEPRT